MRCVRIRALTAGTSCLIAVLAGASGGNAGFGELAARPFSEVDLNVRFQTDGPWFNVDDDGLGIHVQGELGANGVVKFRGNADGKLEFEARPMDSARPPQGYFLRGKTLSAHLVRFGEGFTIEGHAGAIPLSLTLRRANWPDRYEVVDPEGTRLEAWIQPSFARIQAHYDSARMSPESLSVLGAAVGLWLGAMR